MGDDAQGQEANQPSAKSNIAWLPWKKLFVSLDADRDGKLGIGELRRGLAPHAGAELRSWLTVLDHDGNGAIDWAEWIALALLQAGLGGLLLLETQLFEMLFRLLDAGTGDGGL